MSTAGGERKRVTFLFADIRGSTGLIDSLDPELAMQRLNPALRCMKEAVEAYDGVVTRTQGDGIMAFFGAPRPREDHAVRACLAALAMQDAVRRLDDPQINIRVGVHTGDVVVQAVNNTLYQTYDAVGHNVHLASRLEQLADGGGILLSASTVTAAKHAVNAEPLGQKTLRGLSSPVEVFRLAGVRHASMSELFRSRPYLSQLVGRDEVLGCLEHELAKTAQGEGRTVGVVGDAGIGKSRLCFEFADHCRARGVRVYEARVLAYCRAMPFQPMLELLRDYFEIQDADATTDARLRVTRKLRELPIEAEIIPLVLDFVGVGDPTISVPALDPATRKARLLDFISSLPRSGPRGQTTVIMIEDLHWIDAASAEFVKALADAVAGTTTMLLLNFRPGVAAGWMLNSNYKQISVPPLELSNADELLRSLVGEDGSLERIRSKISERAQGNPFFIEELVYSLVEHGDLKGRRGSYCLADGIDNIPLPSTVEAVLTARIDRLPEIAKLVLQTAAVIGREVPIRILELVTNLRPDGIVRTLGTLRDAQLLDQLGGNEEVVHVFRHPLIQEVAYRSLLHERRRKLHADVARALEVQPKFGSDEHASLLAYHLEQAGEALKAARANVRAATWVGATDSGQALRSWRKVLELASSVPRCRETDGLRIKACNQIMNFGWREGMTPSEAQRYFEQGRDLAVAAGNIRSNALAHMAYGRIIAACGSADDYLKIIREAEALARKSDNRGAQVILQVGLCQALRLGGKLREALSVNIEASKHIRDIAESERPTLAFDAELWLNVTRGQLLVTLGRFDEARPYLDRLLQQQPGSADLTHHLASVAYVDLAWVKGDIHLAEEHATRAVSLALKTRSPYVRVHALACRGLSHIVANRWNASIEDLTEALAFSRERKAGLEIEARILADLSNAYYLSGELRRAADTAGAALEVARARAARVAECLAHIVMAYVLLATGEPMGRVADEVHQAQSLMEATGAMIYQRLIETLNIRTSGMHSARSFRRG